MDAMTYTTLHTNLTSSMDRVCNDHEALIITRNGNQAVVMLSLEDYKALEETVYLLRTPENVRRLLSAAEQLNGGKGPERELAVQSGSLPTRHGRVSATGRSRAGYLGN